MVLCLLSAASSDKTVLPSCSHLVGSPVYGFNQLPFTFPGKGSPFNLTSWIAPPSVISLVTYGPSQCILNFPRNLSNLLSYNKTKSFTLKVRNLMCRSCHAFSRSFWTCWWNPARNQSSSSSASCASLYSRASWSTILVSATLHRLGTMYSIGITASMPYMSPKGVCRVSFFQVIL